MGGVAPSTWPTLMGVTREEFDWFVPLLTEHFEAVVAALEVQAAKNRRSVKVGRREVLETYLATDDVRTTAARCHVSPSAVRHVLARAVRHTRRLAGIQPGGLPCDLIEWPPDADDDDPDN